MDASPCKILAIDDNPDNLVTYKALINESIPNAEVFTALNGPAGIALAQREDPDVILLDIIMPGMDGIEVCRRLKENSHLREIPVVFVTAAKGDRERRILALEVGAEAFLGKPVDESELTAQIRAMLKIRAANLLKRNEKERLTALVNERTAELQKAHVNTLKLFDELQSEYGARQKSEERHRRLFETMAQGGIYHAPDGKILFANPAAERILGLPESELKGKSLLDMGWKMVREDGSPLLPPEHPTAVAVRTGKACGPFILGLSLPQRRQQVWLLVNAIPLYRASEDASFQIYTMFEDITERRKMEEELRLSEEKYRLIAESVSDVIWVYNFDRGMTTFVSPSVYKSRGLTVEEAMVETIEQAMQPAFITVQKKMIAKALEELKRNAGASGTILYEVQRLKKDGSPIWNEDSIRCRYNVDGEAEVFGISRNIQERKEQEDKLRYMSYHDQLTGLYNRRFFEEELRKLDTSENLPISVIMGDINGLKLVNDSFGHAMGDRLLERAATIIKSVCRPEDVIARLGGDEFIILLPKASSSEASQAVARIKDLISKEKIANIDISFSFGYDTKENWQQHILEVLSNAENHMYRNKLHERSSMRSKTVDIIMNTLFEKSSRELMHSRRVSELCKAIASQMNFEKDVVNQISIAGLVHDIGKIGVDENILNKAGRLTEEEWREIVKHPETGWRILSSTSEFSELARFILEHHERWDGSGYPKGLKGEEISLEARIISVADAYDAMTSRRTYREEISRKKAIEEIKRCAGTQFDPAVVDVFLNLVLTPDGALQKKDAPA